MASKKAISLTAPNGAVYFVCIEKDTTVARLTNDEIYRESVLCYLFRNGIEPVKGNVYYNPLWETKYPVANTNSKAVRNNCVDVKCPPRKRPSLSPEYDVGVSKRMSSPSPLKEVDRNKDQNCERQEVVQRNNETQSCEIDIFGIPIPFFENHFLYHLEKSAQEQLHISPNVKLVSGCSEFNNTDGSVSVRFVSDKVARDVSSRQIIYRNVELQFRRKEIQMNVVKVENLPFPFFEEFFVFSFNEFLKENFLVQHDAVVECRDYNENEKTIVLEVSPPDIITKLLWLKYFDFEGQRLSFCAITSAAQRQLFRYAEEDCNFAVIDDPEELPSNERRECHSQGTAGNSETSDSDSDLDDAPARKERISLTSDEGTAIFFRNIIRLKTAFDSDNHAAAYARLAADLSTYENVDCDVKKLQGKRKYMFATYNNEVKRGNHTWKYMDAVAVLKGDKQVECLTGTHFDPTLCAMTNDESLAELMSKYVGGAVWTGKSIRALIAAYAEYKDKFDDPIRHTCTWKKIGRKLEERDMYYTAIQCEQKMSSLKKQYKTEMERLRQTGAPGPSEGYNAWKYFDDLHEVMVGDVTVEPFMTLAAGSSNTITSHSNAEKDRKSTKYVPLKERTVTALERMSESMARKAELAEELLRRRL